jgi:hypothetical protein
MIKMGKLMQSLGLGDVSANVNEVPDGKYDAVITQSEWFFNEAKDTVSHVINYKIEGNDPATKGKGKQEFFNLGTVLSLRILLRTTRTLRPNRTSSSTRSGLLTFLRITTLRIRSVSRLLLTLVRLSPSILLVLTWLLTLRPRMVFRMLRVHGSETLTLL